MAKLLYLFMLRTWKYEFGEIFSLLDILARILWFIINNTQTQNVNVDIFKISTIILRKRASSFTDSQLKSLF